MPYRIYLDESGTHSEEWLVIGALFVPDHGSLHAELCAAKDALGFLNTSPKYSAKYKETHLHKFRSPRDIDLGRRWLDSFVRHSCYYRSVVVDWSIWDSSYFGTPFEPEALKKRRGYKKWAEMLLHPELKNPCLGQPIYHAKLFLDRLRILHGYDVIPDLEYRFKSNYKGESPYIDDFQHTDSKHDANQCLQLCDLLTGCLYQSLVPSTKPAKLQTASYLAELLKSHGVKEMTPKFWRGYAPNTLTQHFPKFSAWFWQPSKEKERKEVINARNLDGSALKRRSGIT